MAALKRSTSSITDMMVDAVDKPKLHFWETVIMRITRHPQIKKWKAMIEFLKSLKSDKFLPCYWLQDGRTANLRSGSHRLDWEIRYCSSFYLDTIYLVFGMEMEGWLSDMRRILKP